MDLKDNVSAIFENANETIILLDKDYRVLDYNKMAKQRLLENTHREIYKGADFRDYLYPGREKLFTELFTRALEGKTEEIETNARNAAGEEIWFRSKLFPVYTKKGELMGIALFALNVTDRKTIELSLQESEEKFRKIMESAPTPIIAIDQNLAITILNKETMKVFGYSKEELDGQEIGLLIPGKDDFFQSILKGEKADLLPIKIDKQDKVKGVRKDGKGIYLEINVNTFMVKSECFIILILSDITEQIKAEQKILDQYHLLQIIAREQSHEVRRPVANILGIVNIFQTIDGLSEEEKELYLNCLYKATTDLDEIIRRIVMYASVNGEDEMQF